MSVGKLERLVRTGVLTSLQLQDYIDEAASSGKYPEDVLLEKGVPKHELLFCLAEHYGYPFVEYDEGLMAPYLVTMRLDLQRQKKALWYPLSVEEDTADVVAYAPEDPAVAEDIRRTLNVSSINFRVALPCDLVRIIENNFDVNPNFSIAGGRTPLAHVRTSFAYRRSTYAYYRTLLARGRTGLAFIRTGISFITISVLFLRIFGTGWYAVLNVPLLIGGIVMIYDGVKWYLPCRSVARKPIDYECTEPTWGTTVLESRPSSAVPVIERSGTAPGAEELREGWDTLSPVMRRRFLASDRTDLAEERTSLAGYRTVVSKARTGLAFTRTGVAFSGLGIGLIRSFQESRWTAFDVSLIVAGVVMILEGFHWYYRRRSTWLTGVKCAVKRNMKESIWDLVFPLGHKRSDQKKDKLCPPVRPTDLPGIWATTGVALERTVLAERRNVMSRLRTVMAHSRTGMAFIRTGIGICGVGAGLMFYFGTASIGWTLLNAAMILAGLLLIIDGFLWAVPAEKMRIQYPYCYGDMEITIPDYGKPARCWGKAVFNHDAD
ncbi:MAG TPA: DUF202 domain-containing protein [Candidatus Sulfobium mesophilum]|nr:DUF202 domain-containing protein [Candidatus Sulfobium mesophilum]